MSLGTQRRKELLDNIRSISDQLALDGLTQATECHRIATVLLGEILNQDPAAPKEPASAIEPTQRAKETVTIWQGHLYIYKLGLIKTVKPTGIGSNQLPIKYLSDKIVYLLHADKFNSAVVEFIDEMNKEHGFVLTNIQALDILFALEVTLYKE